MDREEGTRSVDADMVFHRGTDTFLETRRVFGYFPPGAVGAVGGGRRGTRGSTGTSVTEVKRTCL